MSNNRSIAAVVPVEHADAANAIWEHVLGRGPGNFGIRLSDVPDPNHPGYALEPVTHLAFNDEGVQDSDLVIWFGMKAGDLPEADWGAGDIPSEQDAIAAMASVSFFQRLSDEISPVEHFTAVIHSDEGMGLKRIWEEI